MPKDSRTMKYLQYIGIALGAAYGLIYRLLCEQDGADKVFDFSIYSVSFVWILPIVIGIIPIIFAPKEVLKSRWKPILFPMASVFLFFLFALASGLEDLLCLLILVIPYLIAAGIAGVLVSLIIVKTSSKKLYTIVLLPFLLNPIEAFLPNQTEQFNIESSIAIEASPDIVWEYLVEVPEIKKEEYSSGILNAIGVPRPLRSKLEVIDGETYRIGYFSNGLKLCESVSEQDRPRLLNFKIHMDKSELRDTPTDKHLLNSDYFKFENITYLLDRQEDGTTVLRLSCDYRLQSKMNGYANFWAERVIKDFETRLLDVLKKKVEKER